MTETEHTAVDTAGRPASAPVRMRQATVEDHAAIVAITTEGREFLAAQGLDQWQGGNPSPERVAEDIACGYSYLAVDGATGEPLGTIALCGAAEADYANVRRGSWLTEASNDPGLPSAYLVLHRIAVASAARGRGVATFMLERAVETARKRGFASVRVDTHEGNRPMQGAFLKTGFVRCCEIEITNPLEPNKKRIGFELVL